MHAAGGCGGGDKELVGPEIIFPPLLPTPSPQTSGLAQIKWTQCICQIVEVNTEICCTLQINQLF